MDNVIGTLLKIAAVLILLLTIAAVIAIPFAVYHARKQFKRMETEQAEFAADLKKKNDDFRRRLGLT